MNSAHEPFAISALLEPMLHTIDIMTGTLGPDEDEIVAPLCEAQDALKRAILADERGPTLPPEWTEEAMNWRPPPMSAYTAAAIEGELVALKGTPPDNAKDQLAKTSFQIGRWAGAGYLPSRDGKKTIWRVAKASGAITALGAGAAENIISKNFSRGETKPRTAPQGKQQT